MDLKFIIITILIFSITAQAYSQESSISLSFGSVTSKMISLENGNSNLISNKYKTSFLLGVQREKQISARLSYIIGGSYVRAGGIQLLDEGYAKDNIEFVNLAPPFSVVRNNKSIRLNYISISLGSSYKINENISFGLSLKNLFLVDENYKLEYYVSNTSSKNVLTIWKNRLQNEERNKYSLSPEVSLRYKLADNLLLKTSFQQSVISSDKKRKEFLRIFVLSANYLL